MTERTLEWRAAEAAKPVIDYSPGHTRKQCLSCVGTAPKIYRSSEEITHGSCCPSVVIPEAMAEIERLRTGRVPCKGCGGKDTAAAENALCYNCRNAPHRLLDDALYDAQARLAASEAREVELRARLADYENPGAMLYAALGKSAIERILAGPDDWVDAKGDVLLRLESYIRRAERLPRPRQASESTNQVALLWRDVGGG